MKIVSLGLEKRDLSRLATAVAGMLVFSIGINIFVVPAELYNGEYWESARLSVPCLFVMPT